MSNVPTSRLASKWLMVFAPCGDRGCPHQLWTVTVVKVVGVGVICGRIQINLGRMSWTGHEN